MHRTRRETLRIAVATGSLGLLAACFQTGEVDTFVDSSLAQGRINSIAFLPFRNASLLPPEAREIDHAIGKAFVKRNPGLDRIVSTAEAEEILRPSGVMDDWARLTNVSNPDGNTLRIVGNPLVGGRLINASDSGGVPDGNALRVTGSVLNVDALMQGELVGVVQRDGRPEIAYGGYVGATGVIIRYALFATSDGQLLWSVSAEGLKFTATALQSAPDVMVAINLALTEIYEKVPLL